MSNAAKDRSRYLYRKGKYIYFRMPVTKALVSLPAEGTPEFNRAYDNCIKSIGGAETPAERISETVSADTKHVAFIGGTIGAAISKYQASSEYTNGLKLSSRKKYQQTLDVMRDRIGSLPFAGFDVDAVDIYSEQLTRDFGPSVAARHIDMISLLFKCVRKYPEFNLKGMINPTDGATERYKVKRQNPAWDEDAQEKFYKTAPQHLKEAYVLLRYGAQRGGDCTKIMLSDFDGETLKVVPIKQGTERGEPNLVPCVKPLREMLNKMIRDRGGKHGPVLLNAKGKQWASASDLSERIRDHLISIKLAKTGTKTISMHGLRGNAASEVAELMMGTQAIKIVGGWRSNATPEYYARAAEKKVMGKKIAKRWDDHIEEKAAARVDNKRSNLRSVK